MNKKLKSQRIKNLILSMNEEYCLAFMLYQLLYPDYTQWDNNLKFYDEEVRKIMNSDERYYDYLFEKAKEIILSTNISHRITEEFLNKLWQTKLDKINSFSWFNQFGLRNRMSEFKILYVQDLLSGKHYSYAESRFSIEKKFPKKISHVLFYKIITNNKKNLSTLDFKRRVQRKKERKSDFCRNYLLLTDQLKTVFTKEPYWYEQNNLQRSVEYLLHSNTINLSNVIENLSVTSLLRLEWILRRKYYSYTRAHYTNRIFFDSMISNSCYYWSGGKGILEFYIIKILDGFYKDLYKDIEFVSGFNYHLKAQLNSLNKTIEEYVDLITEEVSEIDNISILQKRQIISKLNDIMFRQNNRPGLKQTRKYRYK